MSDYRRVFLLWLAWDLGVGLLAVAAFGPAMLLGFWVYIRFFGCCDWRFRSYSDSLFQTPKSKQKAWPLRSAPRFGSVFLRSGIHPGASPPVCFAAPPLDVFDFVERSLRSHPRINPSTQPSDGAGTSKAVLELTLIVLSGGKRKANSELLSCGSQPDGRSVLSEGLRVISVGSDTRDASAPATHPCPATAG